MRTSRSEYRITRSTASLALTIHATDSTGPLPVNIAALAETIAVAIRGSYSPGGINLLGYADVGALVVQLRIDGVEYDGAGVPIATPALESREAVTPTPEPCGRCCGSGSVAYGPWGVNPLKLTCEEGGGSGIAPGVQHGSWSWECTVPTDDRLNGDARDAHAVCPVCEPSTSPPSSSSEISTPGPRR